MKRVILFFLFLCFYLSVRYVYAHANTSGGKICYSSGHSIEKKQQIESRDVDQECIITANTNSSKENAHLIIAEDDEDDLERKFETSAKSFILFSYLFIVSRLSNSLKEQLPFCTHLACIGSCKYIVYRALRI